MVEADWCCCVLISGAVIWGDCGIDSVICVLGGSVV